MNFKVLSLKRNEGKEGEVDFTVKVQTESGMTITKSISEADVKQSVEMLSTDVTREMKHQLRKDVAQLEIPDESERH